LEYLNIVLACKDLGEFYPIPSALIEDTFLRSTPASYFTIISCLFYIKDNAQYKPLQDKLHSEVERRLEDLSDVLMNSEKAHLLLDMLSYPHISTKMKRKWIKALYSIIGEHPPSNAEIDNYLYATSKEFWQVNWGDIDLLNSLEKRELKPAY
jgi:hypothetical protein